MSTTSKLEEAEHKVQTLQTGVLFCLPVKLLQAGLTWGRFAAPPSPSRSPLTPVTAAAVVSLEEGGSLRPSVPQTPSSTAPHLDCMSHPR